MPGVAFHRDVLQRDVAAGLAVIGDEALRLVAGERRVRVPIVVQHVALALEPDRGRQQHFLAALERKHRIAFRHVGLRDPIGVLARDDAFRPGGQRIGAEI